LQLGSMLKEALDWDKVCYFYPRCICWSSSRLGL